MKITDSTLVLQSSHHAEVKDVARESLRIWQNGSETTESEVLGAGTGRLRQRASALLQNPPVRPAESPVNSIELTPVQAVADGEASLDPLHDLEMSLLKLLVERFIGHEVRVTTPADLRSETAESVDTETPQVVQNEESRGAGWGMVYNNYQSHYESEQTEFQAQGVVKTADGREITIDIQLNMSREFFSESSMTLRAGDALKDPLVVNFSGSAAELTRERFDFDIDADGVSDQIHFLTPDSGFLALDRNQDGIINNGSELFGTRSGNGFADLARFDSDENGWIDENDAVFDRLRIWSKDAEGRDQLVALGAKGVGAVYLGHITTPFEMKDDDNQLLGVVRESGLYLDEGGVAGTMQQIDLVV
ncbi:MAG: hypothetical protein KZQ73_10830 [Candidatus Thiodiazotropha sp. (ex Semelilucina semeliformis)]|nr:hypothetical protein [Candidatus Thiodiazotropha sp. (ex Semelilucina semeliformis)]